MKWTERERSTLNEGEVSRKSNPTLVQVTDADTVATPLSLRLESHWQGGSGSPSPSCGYTICRRWGGWRPLGLEKRNRRVTPVLNHLSLEWKEWLLLTFHWLALVTWHQPGWGAALQETEECKWASSLPQFCWKATGQRSVYARAQGCL